MIKERIIEICDKVIEWCFYTLLIAVTFSTSLVEVASTLMIAAWIVKKVTDRDLRGVLSVPVYILAGYWVWTMLSCFNSGYPKESFRGVFKVLEYGFIFLAVGTTLNKKGVVRKTINVLMIAGVITCLNGIFQYFAGYDLIRHRTLIPLDYLRRISSSFVHPNDFGVYLLVIGVMLLSLILSGTTKLLRRLSLAAVFVLTVVSLFLTRSRGAWISFSAAFLSLGALRAKRVLGLFLALLLVLFILMPYTVQEHIFDLTNFSSGTTWERLMLWKGTINMIKEHPVLGFGVNTYSRNFPAYKPSEYPDVRYSHNCYLHMASEIGIPGAILFLVFLMTVLIFCLKGILSMPPGERRSLAAGTLAGLVGFSMNSMVDTHMYSVNLAVFFHLLLGFCFALSCHAQKK